MTGKRRGKKPKPLLVDYERLGHEFRDQYLAGVRRLLKAGKLKVQDHAELERLLSELSVIDWAVFIQPPPKQHSRAEHVVRYLARYMTGGPISDRRLIRLEDDQVYFWARSQDKSGRSVPFRLSAVEFLQRWSLHILPRGYTKVRCFGQWAYTKRAAYRELCQQLRPVAQEPEQTLPPGGDEVASAERRMLCSACRSRGVESEMRLIESQHRPSWRELFYGPDHPAWFERVHLPRSSNSRRTLRVALRLAVSPVASDSS